MTFEPSARLSGSATVDRGAQAVSAVAIVLWAAALLLAVLVFQQVSYSVCSGTIVRFPPPTVTWPPAGQNSGLVTVQHIVGILAAAATILGAAMMVSALKTMPTLQKSLLILLAVLASAGFYGLLWLLVEYHIVTTQLDALARCF